MKTAKIVVKVIELACPDCGAAVIASNGKTSSIHDDVADRWEAVSKERLQCHCCKSFFLLPKNPFK